MARRNIRRKTATGIPINRNGRPITGRINWHRHPPKNPHSRT